MFVEETITSINSSVGRTKGTILCLYEQCPSLVSLLNKSYPQSEFNDF